MLKSGMPMRNGPTILTLSASPNAGMRAGKSSGMGCESASGAIIGTAGGATPRTSSAPKRLETGEFAVPPARFSDAGTDIGNSVASVNPALGSKRPGRSRSRSSDRSIGNDSDSDTSGALAARVSGSAMSATCVLPASSRR